MDTFVLNAITQELQQQICPSRINNIFQPDEYSVLFTLWNRRKELRLAISVDARYQYLFLTKVLPGNQILAFGKFLQYHIKGGEIRALSKSPLERVVIFEIVKKDLDGQELTFQLILEIMGRHSNLILIQQDTRKILESIRHVTAAQSSYRRVAPAAEYIPPPQQEKIALANIDKAYFQQLLRGYHQRIQTTPKLRLWKFLLQHIQGLSPLLAKEIEGNNLQESEDVRWKRFLGIAEAVTSGNYQPTLVIEQQKHGKDKPIALSALPLEQFSQQTDTKIYTPESMNETAERYYTLLVERQQYDSLKTSLLSPLSARLGKLQKKREHLSTQHEQIINAEEYKQTGELITANIYQLKKGMNSAKVINYYDEDQSLIDIPLDPRLSPSQNAQRYFKRYNKLKQGKEVTEQRLFETEQQIAHLEELKFFIEDAESVEELKRLQEEMQEITLSSHKQPRRQKRHQDDEPAKPFLRFVSSDGFSIYVGRSSRENALLTQRTASAEDFWLHVHQAPGSHVLILNRERHTDIPERTLIEAASLAAYYSKLRRSAKVDVIYTQRKYVKKPKGSPPGLVTLSQFQTIRVSPQAKI